MKLLATDIDGTISFGDNIIPDNIATKLNEFKEQGNILMIATGRNLGQVKVLLKNSDVKFDYLALCNGAVVYDNQKKKLLYSNEIEGDYSDVISVLNDNYRIDTLDKTYTTKKYNQQKFNWFVKRFTFNRVGYLRGVFLPIAKYKDEKIYTISTLTKNKEKQAEILEDLKSLEGKYAIQPNVLAIDIQKHQTDKERAVEYIREKHEIDKQNVFVIGDSLNDLQMIETFENSATLEHGNEKLKEHAKYIVKDTSEYIEMIMDKIK